MSDRGIKPRHYIIGGLILLGISGELFQQHGLTSADVTLIAIIDILGFILLVWGISSMVTNTVKKRKPPKTDN